MKKSPLEPVLVDSCLALFAAFGAPLRPQALSAGADQAASPPTDELTAAFLAFSGSAMRGTLVLMATFDLVAACRPAEARRRALSVTSAGDWIYVRDWSKELANQLLGRIKRYAVAHGLTFEVGAPTALTGAAMKRALSGLTVPPVRFVSGMGPVSVWLDVKMPPETESKLSMNRVDSPVSEGDIVLF